MPAARPKPTAFYQYSSAARRNVRASREFDFWSCVLLVFNDLADWVLGRRQRQSIARVSLTKQF